MKGSAIRNLALCVGVAAMAAPACGAQSQLVGDWLGTVKAGNTPLHVAWHVAAAKDGTITSTIDNLDQRIYGLPVSAMSVKDNALTLTLDTARVIDGDTINIRGTFTGTISSDGTEIHGRWFQGQTLEVDLKRVSAQAAMDAVAQSQLAGNWQGTLSAGGAQLRLVLHITAGKDGALTATLDSVDQGAYGIPVSAISLKDAKLSLTVDAVHGTYDGTVNKDATEIDGTWSQGQPLALNFKRATAAEVARPPEPRPAPPSDIDGSWTGMLDTGPTKLRIMFKIVNTQDGLTAKLQSPDQSPVWIPATSVKRDGFTLTIEIKRIGAVFTGKLADGLASMDGTFTQMGTAFPLALQRLKE